MAMPEFPHELIQQLKISSRAAAGLSADYPDDPTLSNPPSLADIIASLDPSPSESRCSNCKGKLFRGNKSIICVYCGLRPKYNVVPDSISFTSTIGYQWLLRSLKLDGSEMVKPVTSKTEKTLGQSFAKTEHEIPLSEYLNLKMAWPAETDEEETSVSDKHSGETIRKSLRFPGVAPDKFFFKSNKQDDDFDISSKQQVLAGQADTQDRAAVQDNINLFQSAQSSGTAGISSEVENNEKFAEWEADFQFADQENQQDIPKPSGNKVHVSESFGKFTDFQFADEENQQDVSKPSGDLVGSSVNIVHESESFGEFTGMEIDISAHMDSMFGYGKDLNDGHQTDNPVASPQFGEWNSDETWNNPISDESKNDSNKLDNPSPAFGDDWNSDEIWTNPIPNESPKVDFPNPTDLFTGFDSFPDFEWQTDNANTVENTTTNGDHHTINEDPFDEWNDFTGSSSLKDPISNTSLANEKTSEIDLFSSNSQFEGDFGDFSQPDLHSASTRSTDASAVSNEFEQAVKTEGVSSKSTEPKDEYENLISQMHDLSFMLENDLSIPSTSDAR